MNKWLLTLTGWLLAGFAHAQNSQFLFDANGNLVSESGPPGTTTGGTLSP